MRVISHYLGGYSNLGSFCACGSPGLSGSNFQREVAYTRIIHYCCLIHHLAKVELRVKEHLVSLELSSVHQNLA